ncbi:MAG: hypothetical protein QOG75_2057 [Mycobacterium sp.]|jgi:hypothetical protein|nr:hypothetical protein [Mycobacterium sp.]
MWRVAVVWHDRLVGPGLECAHRRATPIPRVSRGFETFGGTGVVAPSSAF